MLGLRDKNGQLHGLSKLVCTVSHVILALQDIFTQFHGLFGNKHSSLYNSVSHIIVFFLCGGVFDCFSLIVVANQRQKKSNNNSRKMMFIYFVKKWRNVCVYFILSYMFYKSLLSVVAQLLDLMTDV